MLKSIAQNLLAFGLILGGLIPCQAQVETQVSKLHSAYEKALEIAEKPMQSLETRYLEELEKLKTSVQKQGDLTELLKIQDEIKNFQKEKKRDFSNSPNLRKLRSIFENARRKIRIEVQEAQKKVLASYIQKSEDLKIELTKQGDVAAAVEIDKFQKKLAEKTGAGTKDLNVDSSDVLWSLKSKGDIDSVNNCVVKKKSGVWVLTSPNPANTFFNSEKSFSPPFKVKLRAMTDGGEIRFFYTGKQIVILNWLGDVKQLRLQNPVDLKHIAVPEAGYIEPNEFHELEVRVFSDKIRVFAGEQFRGEMFGEFGKLDGPFGVGPGQGSTVFVETFQVEKLGLEKK